MEKLILIDGSSLLSTSFFGNLPREYMAAKTDEDREKASKKILQTATGVYTNGVLTMTKILLNLFKEQKPEYFAVAWDIDRNTFRRQMYTEYKANRTTRHPALSVQFTVMQDLLAAMNVPQFKLPSYEADDILGTLARKFESQIPVRIMTKDQDALQLVSSNTRVWLNTSKTEDYKKSLGIEEIPYHVPKNFFEFTPLTFEAIYGLRPIQMIDKKALEGDASDNIPGVRGVSDKTAVPLLQEFGSIEEIYNRIEDLSPAEEKEFKELCKELGIRSPLTALLKESDDGSVVGKEAAFLSKTLATIKTDLEGLSDVSLSDLAFNLNHQGMEAKFTELEFSSLKTKKKTA